MSTGALTSTSYAVLGLLAIQPWTTYELTQQMSRSLGRMWPRAESKLYEEPKKLVAHGMARSSKESVGRRSRTVYAITPKGRRALTAWLRDPGDGPVLEWEQLVKVFFAEHGRKADALATIAAAGEWARARAAESAEIGRQYLEGTGPFPQRRAQQQLTAGFLNDLYALVADWSAWASAVVEGWPEDLAAAEVDPEQMRAIVDRASRAAEGR